ncbi:MAG: LLM class flavin-dependent oxidoreductase [Pseudomonadota bacterium]
MTPKAPFDETPTNPSRNARPALAIAVGAWAIHEGITAADYAAQGALAEELGFHSYWLPENHFGDQTTLPSPLMTLTAVAATTSRLGLGTGSYLLPIRHPLLAAEEVAVLDRLSNGRVMLGVGRGYQGPMFRAFDVSIKEKRNVFERSLGTMIEAWSGVPVPTGSETKAGTPETVTLSPLPVQRPHPPIWIAAFGPKALAQAGRLGLPYIASPVETLEVLAANLAVYDEALRDADQTPHHTVPVMRTTFVSRSATRVREVKAALAESAREMAKSPTAAMRRAGDAAIDDWALVGEPNEVADRIAAYRDGIGLTHLIATRTRLRAVKTPEMVASMELLAGVAQTLCASGREQS